MLGSSLNNPGLKRLRIRDGLIPLQAFRFEAAISKDSRGCIYKASVLEDIAKASPPYEHREAVGEKVEVDYALISFFADREYLQSLVSMAGITTAATLAAASFMCNDKSVSALQRFVRKRCKCKLTESVLAFEIVLEVAVKDGLPLSAKPVDASAYKA